MRRLISDICLTVLLPLWLLVCAAQAQFNNFPPGTFGGRGALDAAGGGGGGYTGPGDIFAFKAWYGMRAYSAATRGNKAVNVCDQATGATCVDWSTDATTGLLVPTTVGGSACSSITCEVAIWYDQTGALSCAGSTACDLVNTHASATRPVVTSSSINTSYCITYVTSSFLTSANSITQAQPFSMSLIGERTGAFMALGGVFGQGGTTVLSGYHSSTDHVFIYAGNAVPTAVATDSAFHTVNSVFNDTTSIIKVDGGILNSVSLASTTGLTTALTTGAGTGQLLTGILCETGVASGDQSANFATLNTNQHAAYGSW